MANNIADESEEWAKAKVTELFGGKGYSEADFMLLRSALSLGYLAGAMAMKNRINERIEAVLAGRTQ